jgi:uncharacterized protein (TIGR02145 family)
VDDTVCYNTAATLVASAPAVLDSVFHWYASQTSTTVLHTGATYTTGVLIANTSFFVSVSGDNYCENATNTRKEVKVKVNPHASSSDIIASDQEVCYGVAATLTVSSTTITTPVFYWYNSQTAVTPFHIGNSYTTPPLTLDAEYYVTVSGDDYCENTTGSRVKVKVTITRPTIVITTSTPTVCDNTPVTFTSAITHGGSNTASQWYVNGTPSSGATTPQFTYTPKHNDVVTCRLTSNATCAYPPTVTSSGITLTVLVTPVAPILLASELPAYPGELVDLMDAVDVIPGMTYVFYEDPAKVTPIVGSIVVYNPPKDNYYVAANNGYCEGPVVEITLQIPCPLTVDDVEGNTYKVTYLAGFCWTENLRSTVYSDSTAIAFAKPYSCPSCAADLDTIFGLLYSWYSAVGEIEGATAPLSGKVQGICPDGWRIPSQAEWNVLNRFSADDLKSTQYWLSPLGPGNDLYGFDALPAGWYNGGLNRYQDMYGFAGWWACDAPLGSTANYFSFSYYCNDIQVGIKNRVDGLSVRCIMEW